MIGRDDSIFGIRPGAVVPSTKPQATFGGAPHSGMFNSQSGTAGGNAPSSGQVSAYGGSVPAGNGIQGTGIHGYVGGGPAMQGALDAGNYLRYGMSEGERQGQIYGNSSGVPGVDQYSYDENGKYDPAQRERYTSAYDAAHMWKPPEAVQTLWNNFSTDSRDFMNQIGVPGVGPERNALIAAQAAGMRLGSATAPSAGSVLGATFGNWGMPDAYAAGYGGGNNPYQGGGNYDPNNPNNAPGTTPQAPPVFGTTGYGSEGGYGHDPGSVGATGDAYQVGGDTTYYPGHSPVTGQAAPYMEPDWSQAGYGPNPGDTTPTTAAAPGSAAPTTAGSYAPPYSGYQGQSMFNPYTGQYNGPTSANFYATNMS